MSQFKPYGAYKDSGSEWLGSIPKHWEVKRLRYVASLNPLPDWGALSTSENDCPFLPMEAIGEDGSLDLSRTKPLHEAKKGYSYFAEGDVVFAKVTPCFENGKGALLAGLNGGHGFGTTELTVLRSFGMHPELLYLLTCSHHFRHPGASEMLGSGGLKRVPDEFVLNFPVAVPPLQEQVEILNGAKSETARIDALIEKKTLFIDLLKQKRQALITQAVTKGLDPNVKMKGSGVEWIGEVPAHWTVLQLGKVATDRCDGPFGSGLKSEHYSESGVRVVRLQNIGPDVFRGDDAVFISEDYHQNSLGGGHDVVQGDLLLAGLGDDNNLLGRACVAPDLGGPAMVKADCFRFRLDQNKVNPSFMANQLSATAAHECGLRATGATRSRLNLGLATARVIAIPSVEEQCEIMEYLSHSKARLDLLADKTQESIALLKERRTALITAAVTGQIDLREDIA